MAENKRSTSGAPQDEDVLGKAYDGALMRRLLGYLRPYRFQVGIAISLLVAAAGIQILGPWLISLALDEAIPNGDLRLLTNLALAFLVASLATFGLEYAQALLTTWLGQKVMVDLRTEIFDKLQRLDLPYYDRNPVGRLMTRITSDVETLNELFSSGVVAIFGDIFTLIFIVSAMLFMDWQLALVTFSVLPFVLWTAFVFRARIRDAYREIRIRVARLNAFLHERITGVRVVQLFDREGVDSDRHAAINQDYLEAHLKSITYYALFFPIIEGFTAIALALILVAGGFAALDGVTTVGVVTAFLLYARRFFRPIQDLSERYNVLQGAMASSERIFRLLDETPVVQPPRIPTVLPTPIRGEIEFRDVWFAYGRTEEGAWDWILKGVSFRVAPGERIAIVGHTGAGKTTLINLILRFQDPQRGQILLDGIPLTSLDPQALREPIGLVLQDVFLFSDDLRFNIRLGRTDISEARVYAAAEEVGALPFIERLPAGFDQPLGERGASLSVGERQLISFARALAFDPRILILDEATSSVDSELEARIEAATQRLLAGRTSLMIAHRLSTVQEADRILVLHRGEVREQGSHTQLLALGGLYARLHELQFAAHG